MAEKNLSVFLVDACLLREKTEITKGVFVSNFIAISFAEDWTIKRQQERIYTKFLFSIYQVLCSDFVSLFNFPLTETIAKDICLKFFLVRIR